ncbi:blue-light-activated protein [bacterium BMS3Bbin06]|nr:blue-light-activated protein [bacterium BMS3Bbin06]HDO35031.1 PAS domain S-box protein [Nitrospirota bacterium]
MLKVLVVDDKKNERQDLEKLIGGFGHAVSGSPGGKEALELIRTKDFDLLLLDIFMPGRNGVQVLKDIKSASPGIDVIFITADITADSTLEEALASMKEGTYAFLMRPFTNNEIFLSIERVKEKRQLQKERTVLEENLKKAAEEWRFLFDSMEDAVFMVDDDYNIIRGNRKFSEIIDTPLDEITGKKCYNLVHNTDEPPDSCPRNSAVIEKACRKAEFYEPYLKRYLLASVSPACNGKDGKNRYIHIIRDITEQKRLENRLEETKEKVLKVYEFSPFPVGILTNDYVLKYVNPKMAEFLLSSPEEIIGKQCYEVIYGRDIVCDECLVEEVKRKRLPVTDEMHVITASGKEFYFDRTFYPLFDFRGEVEDIVEAFKDVTEQKIAEKKLMESQAFLSSVLGGIGDAVIVIDRDMRIVSANSGYLKQTKRSREEIIGKHCYEISHGYAFPCYEVGEDCAVKKTFEDGRPHTAVHEHVCENGSKIYAETNAYPLKDPDGEEDLVVETVSDVTDRMNLQMRLEESERRYRTLYNNAPDLMHSLDEDGYIIECNDTELKVLGYERVELVGRHLKEILPEKYHEQFNKNFNMLKDTGAAEIEWEVLKKDGSTIDVLVKSVAIYDGDGNFIKTSTIMHDVTELKSLEREREELQRQLLQAQKMEAIGNLAAGIAHDFNNMLTGISGFSEIALTRTDSPEVRNYMRRIFKITKQAASLTNQILIIGRKAPVRKKPFDLNLFVGSSLLTLRRMVEENIVISTELCDDIHLIEADEGQFYQVLLNLVVNARDEMPEGGKITIKTYTAKGYCNHDRGIFCVTGRRGKGKDAGQVRADYVCLSVIDTGPGIPEEIRNRIFDPFFTTKEAGRGTGLGLAVVYSVVQGHGGCIEISTKEGSGTEFRLYFPAVLESFVDEGNEEVEVQGVLNGKGKRILIADDEEVVREFLHDFLSGQDFEVLTVKNGDEALKVYSERPDEFDLVILDLVMPGISGMEVHYKIRDIRPEQKVIISTGYALSSELEDMESSGVTGVLKKPFSMAKVNRVLRYAFDG